LLNEIVQCKHLTAVCQINEHLNNVDSDTTDTLQLMSTSCKKTMAQPQIQVNTIYAILLITLAGGGSGCQLLKVFPNTDYQFDNDRTIQQYMRAHDEEWRADIT